MLKRMGKRWLSVFLALMLTAGMLPLTTVAAADAPSIVTQPSGCTAYLGGSVTFTVEASRTTPLSYQWRKNNVNLTDGGNISGATTAALTISNLTAADGDNYTCKVSNDFDNITTRVATLTVKSPAPSLVKQPSNQTVSVGQSASFTVNATGAGTLTYQWYDGDPAYGDPKLTDGGNISGATTATLTISNLTLDYNYKYYSCVITNAYGSKTSNTAWLTVKQSPAIMVQPTDASREQGDFVTFSVTAAGNVPFTYHWYKDGTVIANGTTADGSVVLNAGTDRLTIQNLHDSDIGSYSCQVSNTYGSAASNAAKLTVTQPQKTLTSVTAPAAITGVASGTAKSAAALGLPASVTLVTDKGDVSGNITWEMQDSSYDPSKTTAQTFMVGGNAALPEGVVNTNHVSLWTFVWVTVDAAAVADPRITSQPESRTASAGWVVEFRLMAQGTGTLSYQWKKGGVNLADGENISGATTNDLTIGNVQASDAGNYYCCVSNGAGNVTSDTVTLTVNPAAPSIVSQPIDQTATVNDSVSFTVGAAGTEPFTYQWRKDGTALINSERVSGAAGATVSISGLTAADAGRYSCLVTNSEGNVVSDNAVLTINLEHTSPSITTQPADQIIAEDNSVTFTVVASGNTPITYQWKKDGVHLSNGGCISGANSSSLRIGSLQISDAGTYTCVVTNAYGSVNTRGAVLTIGTPATYTVAYNPGANGTGGSPQTATKTQCVPLALLGATYTRSGYTQTGWAASDGGDKAYELGGSYATDAAISLYPAWTANTYTVSYDGNKPAAVSETVTGLSGDQSCTYDTDFKLGAAPTLAGYAFDGWYKESGCTNKAGDAGASVSNLTVTNGATVTLYAKWTEVPAITIVIQPASTTVVAGSIMTNLTAAATVSLSGIPSYQWYSCTDASKTSAQAVTDAAGATLTIPTNLTTGTYYYFCRVSATGAASVDTNVATVTVNEPPSPVKLGTPVSLTWDGLIPGKATWNTVDHISSYTVQLYKGGAVQGSAVTGITATTYDFTAVIVSAGSGSYTFRVTAIGGGTNYTDSEQSAASTPYTYIAPVATYTVTFSSNGSVYTTKIVNAGESIGSAAWPIDPTRGSYTFGGWFTGENGAGAQFTSATPVNATTTVYAKWTYGGGDGDSQSIQSAPTYYADVKAGNGTKTTLPVAVDKDNGSAAVDTGSYRFTSGDTVITMPSIPDAGTYSVIVPVPDLSTADNQGTLTLNTETGSVTVPSNMLTGVAGISGSKAEISISQGNKRTLPADVKSAIGDKPLIQLGLSIDGKQTDWSNPNAAVTVSIPYTPTADELKNPESIVIWYIDGVGNVVTIPNGRYDPATGTVTFNTTHFSDYAVAYNLVSFHDVTAGAWYHKAVSFIAARGITGGTGNGYYSPDAKLTRGEFLVTLMKAYGIAPDSNSTDNFSDAGDTYYTGYLAAAKRLGITAGVGNNQYTPGKEITRQEMFTLLYNTLKVIGRLPQCDSGKTLSDFTDAGQIDSWAKDAMTLLVETGTVGGNAGKLSPTSTTTRAEMAQVLYNLLGK